MLTPDPRDKYDVIDGFLYRRSYRCNYTFESLAVEQYNALRRAGAFRQKQWCIPEDAPNTLIPKFDSYEYELDVGAGAAIWGYALMGACGDDENGIQFTTSVQVEDACNGVSLFSEAWTQQNTVFIADQFRTAEQVFLTKPYIVGAPGLLKIEIASLYPTDRIAQVILYGGVPDRG